MTRRTYASHRHLRTPFLASKISGQHRVGNKAAFLCGVVFLQETDDGGETLPGGQWQGDGEGLLVVELTYQPTQSLKPRELEPSGNDLVDVPPVVHGNFCGAAQISAVRSRRKSHTALESPTLRIYLVTLQ